MIQSFPCANDTNSNCCKRYASTSPLKRAMWFLSTSGGCLDLVTNSTSASVSSKQGPQGRKRSLPPSRRRADTEETNEDSTSDHSCSRLRAHSTDAVTGTSGAAIATVATNTQHHRASRRNKNASVRFQPEVTVYYHGLVLGDHPDVSNGPPLRLDRQLESQAVVPLRDTTSARPKVMPFLSRQTLALQSASREEVEAVQASVMRIRANRLRSSTDGISLSVRLRLFWRNTVTGDRQQLPTSRPWEKQRYDFVADAE